MLALIRPVIDFFREVPFGDFFATEGQFAVFPLIAGTAMVTVIALLVAVPLGLGAAMYLSEYASPRARKVLKPTVELLAGVPSVVYGFFAVFFVTPTLLQDILGLEVNFTNALSAGLVLGVMVVPTVASLSEDAFSAVPQALRQGSLAMGANRMQTTLRVVLPAALSGVAAAIVLGMSRAVGETMIVALAAGAQKNLSADPREGMQTMTGFIAQTAKGENPVGLDVVQHAVRCRTDAVRHHAGHQHRQHRPRASLQAGVLMATAAVTAREVTAAIASGKSKDRTAASLVFLGGLWFSLFFGVMVLIVLIVSTLIDGAPRFDSNLITDYDSAIRPETTGFRAGILGSLWLMAGTAVLAVPLGIAAALYLEEFADNDRWYNRLIEVNLQNLAAVPSIVYGLLALATMAVLGFERSSIVLGGALALALLILPVIIITTREAVRAVPQDIRQGSLALGATVWQTTWRQTLPSAIPGIATGTILGLSRAIGEAAPLLLLGVAVLDRLRPDNSVQLVHGPADPDLQPLLTIP